MSGFVEYTAGIGTRYWVANGDDEPSMCQAARSLPSKHSSGRFALNLGNSDTNHKNEGRKCLCYV